VTVVNRRDFLLGVLSSPVALAGSASARPVGRCIMAIRDKTPSFKFVQEATNVLKKVVVNTGLGDEFTLIDLGGPFEPGRDVKVQALLPSPPADLGVPAGSVAEWRRRQASLTERWSAADRMKLAIEHYLSIKVRITDSTPLFQSLEYASDRLSASPSSERQLLVCSDFVQDAAGLKSTMPPKETWPLAGVVVTALFAPWRSDWAARRQAWDHWFTHGCGAASFHMFDEAQSKVLVPLAPSPVPRNISKSF
jgi:hypothetical protein